MWTRGGRRKESKIVQVSSFLYRQLECRGGGVSLENVCVRVSVWSGRRFSGKKVFHEWERYEEHTKKNGINLSTFMNVRGLQ